MFLFVSAFFFLICVSVPLYLIVFSVFHCPKYLTFHNTLNVRFVPNIVPTQKKTRCKHLIYNGHLFLLCTPMETRTPIVGTGIQYSIH